MYQRAVQTPTNWAFAYEIPTGGYAIQVAYIGDTPILDNEPEFAALGELQSHMEEIAPLDQWSEEFFKQFVFRNNDVLF